MARITKLENVVFPVEEHPVFAHIETASGERRVRVPGRKAIVNSKSGCVLGIVSRDYRLVSNSEALEMATQCCQTVFPETKPVEWEVQAVDAPGTAGYCQIDLAHNSTALDFQLVAPDQRPEVFGPFISVTNSYNGLRALAFNIGFYRKICKNGMIWPESMIRFSFAHNLRDLGEEIQFEVAHEKLTKVRSNFGNCLTPLRKCSVPRVQFVPMLCGVLHVHPVLPSADAPAADQPWRATIIATPADRNNANPKVPVQRKRKLSICSGQESLLQSFQLMPSWMTQGRHTQGWLSPSLRWVH